MDNEVSVTSHRRAPYGEIGLCSTALRFYTFCLPLKFLQACLFACRAVLSVTVSFVLKWSSDGCLICGLTKIPCFILASLIVGKFCFKAQSQRFLFPSPAQQFFFTSFGSGLICDFNTTLRQIVRNCSVYFNTTSPQIVRNYSAYFNTTSPQIVRNYSA
jgi:hypothetical protein